MEEMLAVVSACDIEDLSFTAVVFQKASIRNLTTGKRVEICFFKGDITLFCKRRDLDAIDKDASDLRGDINTFFISEFAGSRKSD